MFGIELATWLLVFLRASGLLAVFPLFTARNFPVQLRVALSALLALLIAPGLPAPNLQALPLAALLGRMSQELLIGLLLGFASRMLFYALDVAGGLISSEMGLNLPATLNPFADTQLTVPALILYYLAAVLFLSLDLHHWLLVAFQRSYAILPMGASRLEQGLLADLLGRTCRIFEIAARMAAPFIGVSFIVTLVFSVLGRAVTQMNVFAESFAVRTLAGLVVFGLSCELLGQHILHYLRRLPEDVLRVAQLLAGNA